MGSYLSKYLRRPEPAPLPRASERPASPPAPAHGPPAPAECEVLDVHREHVTGPQPDAKILPALEKDNLSGVPVPEASKSFPNKLPSQAFMGPDLPCSSDTYSKCWLCEAQNPGRVWMPVNVKITPPEQRRPFAASPAPQARPDPSAKETVLRALNQYNQGKRKSEEPPGFEIPNKKRRSSPETRPSAFRPVVRNGVVPSFVPRLGPLNRGPHCRSENVCKIVRSRVIQPLLSAVPPAAEIVPAQGTGPLLQSWAKTQHSWGFQPSCSVHGRCQKDPSDPQCSQPAGPSGF